MNVYYLSKQQQHMVAQQVRATNNRSTTPKARNTSTPGLQQTHSSQRAQRTATPNHTVQQQMVSPSAGKTQIDILLSFEQFSNQLLIE